MLENNQVKEEFDIIMFNMSAMSDWKNGISNRNFNIFSEMANDPRVKKLIAVDFLPRNFKGALKMFFNRFFKQDKNRKIIFRNLTSEFYQENEKVYVYSTILSVFSKKLLIKELLKIEDKLNLKNVICWSYNPMFLDFLGKLNEKLFVFDTVDNWAMHSEYIKLMEKDELLSNYRKIADRADLIFTVANELVDFYRQHQRTKDIFWIPNGVDFEHLNNLTKINQKTILDEVKEPIIGYLGTITSNRVDFDLLEDIAKNHPDNKLVLAGPVWADLKPQIEKLSEYKNVLTLGRIKWDLAPAILDKFAVGIIPHKSNSFISWTNPMKMFDYLACGLPVVTTNAPGCEIFEDSLYISSDTRDFNEKINLAIAEDSPEKRALRKSIVAEHSWKNRVATMLEELTKKFNDL